jgi:hypothetical protein
MTFLNCIGAGPTEPRTCEVAVMVATCRGQGRGHDPCSGGGTRGQGEVMVQVVEVKAEVMVKQPRAEV